MLQCRKCSVRILVDTDISLIFLGSLLQECQIQGQILKRAYGTITYRARKIGTYSENNVPHAWLKQSE